MNTAPRNTRQNHNPPARTAPVVPLAHAAFAPAPTLQSERTIAPHPPNPVARTGFVLPLVLVTLAVIGILAFSLSTITWRQDRATTDLAISQQLSMSTDAALTQAVANWRQDSIWARPLNDTLVYETTTPNSHKTQIRILRPHPLTAWITAYTWSTQSRSKPPVQRQMTRVMWLSPPSLEISAAAIVYGKLVAHDNTLLSGIDLPGSTSPCGPERDTLSIHSLAAIEAENDGLATWALKPTTLLMPPSDTASGTTELLNQAAHFGPVVSRSANPDALPATAQSPGWHLLSLKGSNIVLSGNSDYSGLLVVDGNLHISGTVKMQGILLVTGNLNVTSGSLNLLGALIVLGSGTNTGQPVAQLGGNTTVRYDRCRAQMALATTAEPKQAPYMLWQSGPP